MDYYPNKKEHAAAVKAKKAAKKVKRYSTMPVEVLLQYAAKPEIFKSLSSVLTKEENYPAFVTYAPAWKLVGYIARDKENFQPKSFRTKVVPAGRHPVQQTWLTFGRLKHSRKSAIHTIEIPIQRVEGVIKRKWTAGEDIHQPTLLQVPAFNEILVSKGIMPLADGMREVFAAMDAASNIPLPPAGNPLPPWYQKTSIAPVTPNFSRPGYQLTQVAPVTPNPLLMTIMPNPGGEASSPFKNNKAILIAKFESWLRRNGTRDQVERYERAIEAYTKFHQGAKPRTVRKFTEAVGDRDSRKIEREFEFSLGKSPAEIYNVPEYSGKAPYSYVHDYEKLPEVSSPAGGQRIVKRFQGTKTHVSDWIHG